MRVAGVAATASWASAAAQTHPAVHTGHARTAVRVGEASAQLRENKEIGRVESAFGGETSSKKPWGGAF